MVKDELVRARDICHSSREEQDINIHHQMNLMENLMERLRQLVGSNTCWDYCVLWKLSEDQRFLEFMDCCCGGSKNSVIENSGGGGQDELFFPCRDMMFQHPRTTTCQLLAQLPSSHPLDGINMEILISNQPRWLNLSNISNSSVAQVTLSTKVLVPIPGGLAELFAAKQVSEDLNVIEYVAAQCSTLMEQEAMNNSSNIGAPNFSVNMNTINELQSDPSLSDPTHGDHIRDPITNIKESIDTLNLPDTCETTPPDQNPSMNFLQQFSYVSENKKARNDLVEEGSRDSFQTDEHQQNSFKSLSENGFEELMNNAMDMHNLHVMDHSANEQLGNEKGGSVLKHEMSRMDSVSDSYHLDEEDDPKCRRRAVKGSQCKNLMAERRRRKKLNERLYNLRSLVPNISKLDRAAILGDAIKYVQELQKEAEDLQNELERNSDDEAAGNNIADHHRHDHHLLQQSNFPSEISEPIPGSGSRFGPHYDHEKTSNGFHMGGTSEGLKRSYEYVNASDKAQQMEVQVEVGQLEGNDFFVKVFGEQKRGGFVRLMEALNCLGLEITNVNMTSCISLVSYVFVVKRDSEMVQAEYLRDSLIEATRNQAGFWTEMAKASDSDHQLEHPSHQHHLHTHHLTPFHNHFHHFSN